MYNCRLYQWHFSENKVFQIPYYNFRSALKYRDKTNFPDNAVLLRLRMLQCYHIFIYIF
jgi:hypothetical protein